MHFSRRSVSISVALIAIGFFVYHVYLNFDVIPAITWSPPSITVMLASIFCILCTIGLNGLVWHVLLRENNFAISWKSSQTIFLIAQFGKYIPGNIGQHVGRAALAYRVGIPVPITLSIIVVEVLWATAVSALLALLAVLAFVSETDMRDFVPLNRAVLTSVIVVALIAPWATIKGINKRWPSLAHKLSKNGQIPTPRIQIAFLCTTLFLLCFVVNGLVLKAQAYSFFGISDGSIWEFTCLFSVAWLAGFIIPGAPGGLGVRESIMLILLSPVTGPGTAIGLGITLRITTTLADAVALAIGVFWRHSVSHK